MYWLWTWSGLSFGYRDGDNLWTYDGEHVGRFEGDVVYDRDGRYLGEVRGGNRLIADRASKAMTSGSMSFEPAAPRAAQGAARPPGPGDVPPPEPTELRRLRGQIDELQDMVRERNQELATLRREVDTLRRARA